MLLLWILGCTTPSKAQLAAAERAAVPGPTGATGPQGERGEAGVDGRDGVDGEDGAVGATGAPGRDGPHWVDAAGADVTEGAALIWFDASGNYWTVDRETGTVGPADVTHNYYASADCSGDAYVPAYAPREVFEIDGVDLSRPADMLASDVDVSAFSANGTCSQVGDWGVGETFTAIPRNGLNVVYVDRSFTGPLALVP